MSLTLALRLTCSISRSWLVPPTHRLNHLCCAAMGSQVMVLSHGLDSSGQHLDVSLRSRMKHIQSELVLFPPNMCPLPKARKFSFPPSPNPCWAEPPPQCLRKPLCPPHAIAPDWAQDTFYCSWLGAGHILLLLAGPRTHAIAPGWAQDTCYCSWLGAGHILLLLAGHSQSVLPSWDKTIALGFLI